jgi:hypothetical protein
MLHTALVEANSGLFLGGRPAYRCRSGTRQRLPSLGQRGAQVQASNMNLRQLSPPASAGGTSYKGEMRAVFRPQKTGPRHAIFL